LLSQEILTAVFLIGYIVLCFAVLYKNKENLSHPDFLKSYKFLLENRKLKSRSIYVYPLFLIYRLIFEMIPVVLKNKAGYQLLSLMQVTIIYNLIHFGLQTNLKKQDYVIEYTMCFCFFSLQVLSLALIDGGLISGS
jgi:hypothetical protein